MVIQCSPIDSSVAVITDFTKLKTNCLSVSIVVNTADLGKLRTENDSGSVLF